jgi:1,4-alpha-glucan branching enzyme
MSSCAILKAVKTRLPKPQPTSKGILFQYDGPAARQVNLAGNFNNWGGTQGGGRFDPNIDPMTSDEAGLWKIYVPLPPGRYQYKYVIDQVRWEQDPNNPDVASEGGFENSMLVVPEGVRYDVPFLSIASSLDDVSRPRSAKRMEVEFSLTAPDAKKVYLVGDFNDWAAEKDRMKKDEEGVWRLRVALTLGRHEYRFVVDGEWIEDPENPNTVDNPYGGVNSVMEVTE